MIKNNQIKSGHAFKDHRQERQILVTRTVFAFIFVALLMISLLVRSWYLQVVKHEDYQTRSNNNRISVQQVAPNRGLIYDRNGVLLAENRSVYSLEIIPEQVANIDETLNIIKQLELIEDKHIGSFKRRLTGVRRFKSVLVKSRLTEQEVAIFSANGHRLKGARVEARLVRFYPYGEKIAHALGSVRRINDRDLQRIDQANYRATRHMGKVGLEKYYEDVLHGTIGSRTVETDVQGRVIGEPLTETPPVPGHDLKLSLDIKLQLAAADAIGDYRGSVIVIDPRNGDVLALVSNPGYDPNDFVTGISTEKYAKLTGSADQPLFNRALRGLYSPGSTIKPMLAWVGLENKFISERFTINDPGFWVIPNKEERIYRDHISWGHGQAVNVSKAIIESCNPFFYDLAYRMGIDVISENMFNFGFGQSTGIDMGEELTGIMPSREWKQNNRRSDWYPGETVLTGIGQGYWNATPLQLANAVAPIATGGVRHKLRLVIAENDHQQWQTKPPELADRQVDFGDGSSLDIVKRAMEQVNKEPFGTARKAFNDAWYSSAGKTGTVQLKTQTLDDDGKKVQPTRKKFNDNAVYVAYAPADNPEIAIAVVTENAGHGGEAAAPVARQVMDAYFKRESN
ncbi:MAG: penicillin-binding protein 2 [Kangiellaceae bacterium]|jgi:penicillin-binding protein 2